MKPQHSLFMFVITAVVLFFFSCGEITNKTDVIENEEPFSENKEQNAKTLASADYSTLLMNYNCDMNTAEIAKIMEVPEADLSIPEYAKKPGFAETGNCYINLKGFGTGAGGDTGITWGTTRMSKDDIKNEIDGHLKNQKEMPFSITKTKIELAETKDSYIVANFRYGRVIIYNGNYDSAFVISYGNLNPGTDRTKEQHTLLTEKIVSLANYLLKKHKQ